MVALWVAYNIFKPNKKKKKPKQAPKQQAPQQPQNKPRQRKVQPQQQSGQTAQKTKTPSSIESILEDYLKELEDQSKPTQGQTKQAPQNPNVKAKEADQIKPKSVSQTKHQPYEETKSKKITKSSAVLTKQPEAYSFEDNIKEAQKYASKASANERKFAARAKTEKKRKLNMIKKMKSFDFNALDAIIYSEIINRKYK